MSTAPTRPTGSTSTPPAGPATFAYDANGNLTSDGDTTYVYDVENRLVSARRARERGAALRPARPAAPDVGGAAGTTAVPLRRRRAGRRI